MKAILAGAAAGVVASILLAVANMIIEIPVGIIVAAAVVCTITTAGIEFSRRSIAELLTNRTQTIRRRLELVHRNVGDIHGLVRLPSYTEDLPLPIGGGWALTGDSAALLASEVLLNRPSLIVELGSGASTLLTGQILKRRGSGRIVSIDHDAMWAERTREFVRFLGLEHVVTVIDAPLAEISLNGRNHTWYSIPEEVMAALKDIDLLVVDGPPQDARSSDPDRYPAYPVLKSRLSPNATIFVDDARRPTETSMVEKWMDDDPAIGRFYFDTIDGVSILKRHKV